MTKDWLLRRVLRSEVDVEVGLLHEGWVNLRAKLQEGDELWFFSTPIEDWKHMCGRSGYSIVRNGDIVASCITIMN